MCRLWHMNLPYPPQVTGAKSPQSFCSIKRVQNEVVVEPRSNSINQKEGFMTNPLGTSEALLPSVQRLCKYGREQDGRIGSSWGKKSHWHWMRFLQKGFRQSHHLVLTLGCSSHSFTVLHFV